VIAPAKDDLQVVILDVDGTLVDSERHGHRVAFNRAFEDMGLPYRWEPEEYGQLLTIAGGKHRLHAYLEEQGVAEDVRNRLVPELHERKTQLFIELVREGRVPPRPGAARLVEELHSAGITMAVATTGSRAWVVPVLERFFGLDSFRAIITGDEAPVRKPDPSAHRMTLEKVGKSADVAVAIEDSHSGVLAATTAGLTCVAVVNDYTRDHNMDGAALVTDGFGEHGSPADVLHDPHSVVDDGLLRVTTLQRLVAVAH
jgi:HAD superfamily hydrolase (TIGR01509 family)